MQNYGCNPDVGLMAMLAERYPEIARYYLPRVTETVVPNARRLLDGFRTAGRPVVYTRHGPLLADGSDMIARRRRRDVDALARPARRRCGIAARSSTRWSQTLAPQAGELVIDKNTSSAFNSTGIEALLRNMELETLVLAGMATDMCVETTARDAADRGFDVIVVEDATATFFEHHHRAALSGFARVFGQVWDTARVLAALDEARRPRPESRPPSARRPTASARRRRLKTGSVTRDLAETPGRAPHARSPSISTIVASNGGSIKAPTMSWSSGPSWVEHRAWMCPHRTSFGRASDRSRPSRSARLTRSPAYGKPAAATRVASDRTGKCDATTTRSGLARPAADTTDVLRRRRAAARPRHR